MRVNWSERSLIDLEQIASYIERDSPRSASKAATRIYEQIMTLTSMAERGKAGRIKGTREMQLGPLPYFAVYRIVGEDVRILTIRHNARRWPVRS